MYRPPCMGQIPAEPANSEMRRARVSDDLALELAGRQARANATCGLRRQPQDDVRVIRTIGPIDRTAQCETFRILHSWARFDAPRFGLADQIPLRTRALPLSSSSPDVESRARMVPGSSAAIWSGLSSRGSLVRVQHAQYSVVGGTSARRSRTQLCRDGRAADHRRLPESRLHDPSRKRDARSA